MTQVLIDRATLEQLVVALEMPCDRWSTMQFKIANDAIKAGRAALANAEPVKQSNPYAWQNPLLDPSFDK